jgi:hypothetical protein
MMRRPGDAALCGRWYAADVAQSPTVAVLQLKWRGYPTPPPSRAATALGARC